MTHKQALEKLELEAGATASDIQQQYQEFYNEFQMRITNAPTEHQRTLYKKKLDELTLAFETLGGQQAAASTEELPGIAESIPGKLEPKVASPVSDKPKMTKEKALQILGLGEKFTEKELNNVFKVKVEEFEKGKDNAVNDVIRMGYNEAILECNTAHNLLKAFVFAPPLTKPKVSTPIIEEPKMTKEKALHVLGLERKFTKKDLDSAFKAKVSACKSGRDSAMNDAIRIGYDEALIECNAAHTLLKAFVFVPEIKPEPNPKIAPKQSEAMITENKATSKKKWLLPVSILGGVGIGVVLILILMNTNDTPTKEEELIDLASSKKYIALKKQADLFARQGNWNEALSKYEAVYLLTETSEVKDSIESMKNHLLLASVEKDDIVDEQKEEASDKEKDAAITIKEKELEAREKTLKEAERLRQEKESKRIKIGDNYAGGIVFKVDASGKHGLVSAMKNLGRYEWKQAIRVCQNLNLNGYSDWYLPSISELELMHKNLRKESTIDEFNYNSYWSSSEEDSKSSAMYNFFNSENYIEFKYQSFSVCAIRIF